MLATEVHRRFISDCNGRNPRSGAASPLRRFGLALVPRLPVLGGYPAGIPRLVAPCAGADCGDSFTGVDPPGFWFVLQGKDPNLTRLPVLGGYPAATPWFVPPCAGADCGDPPLQASTPRFWVVLQENGPEFDALPGFWAVISVPRRDSRRCLRYNPRSEAFTSSVPRSAAYETAQSFARALCRTLDRAKNGVMGLRNRPKLHSGVWPPSAG